MEDYRRAALCLHALSDVDRDWVLAQLSESHRASLRPLLDELVELGLPRASAELAWDDSALDGPVDVPGYVAPINAASADTVFRLLQREHGAAIALILEYYPWQWREAVIKRLEAKRPRGMRITAGRSSRATSQAVRECVIGAFAKAIAQEQQVAPVRESRLARLTMLAWFR